MYFVVIPLKVMIELKRYNGNILCLDCLLSNHIQAIPGSSYKQLKSIDEPPVSAFFPALINQKDKKGLNVC